MDQIASRRTKNGFGTEAIKTTVSIVILGAGVGLFIWLYSMHQAPPNKESDALIPLVETFEAEPFSDKIDTLISGTVVPAYEITVTSEVNGQIKKKYPEFEAGNYVTKGTKLLEIDPEELNLVLKSNQADLNQAQKMLAETEEEIEGSTRNIEMAEEELTLLEGEHERNLSLWEKRATSDAEVDQSKRALLASKAQLTTRNNTLKSAKARLERMKAAIEVSEARINQTLESITKTTIVAPANGVIVQEGIQEGENATIGKMLLMFENTEKIEVLCTLSSSDLDWIRENNRVDLSGMTPEQRLSSIYRLPKTSVSIYDSRNPDIVWKGMLERVDGIGRDLQTKTIPVRIVVDNPIVETKFGPKALVRNMFVKCRIEVEIDEPDPDKQPLTFPATGIRPGGFVWIATPEKTLARKKVKVLDQVPHKKTGELMAVIRGGADTVLPGDSVITSPLGQGTVGAEVRLINEEDNESKDENSSNTKDE